jgi:hypothetical protein
MTGAGQNRPEPDGSRQALFEIRGTAFKTLAFFTFGDVFYLAVFKQGLHSDFPTAGTKELLGGA